MYLSFYFKIHTEQNYKFMFSSLIPFLILVKLYLILIISDLELGTRSRWDVIHDLDNPLIRVYICRIYTFISMD